MTMPNVRLLVSVTVLSLLSLMPNLHAETPSGDPNSPPTQPGSSAVVNLISKGSVWKYWDAPANPGADWQALGFDDARWAQGPAQLGYGDGDEVTLLGQGLAATEQPVTMYFRQAFTVADATAVNDLFLSILRDDGIVVYLNGTEIHRSNLPDGPVSGDTLALKSINHTAEVTWYNVKVPAASLLSGANVLAVEVHQVVPGSLDMSFDLQAIGNHQPPTVELVSPANNAEVTLPEAIELEATAASVVGQIAKLEFHANSKRLATLYSSPYRLTWSSAPPGTYTLVAKAYDEYGSVTVSAPVQITVNDFAVTEVLLPRGSVWKYLEDGGDQGIGWTAPDFDDSAWQSGPAQLGYGDGDEATVVSYGPDPEHKPITTYFRTTFTVNNPADYENLMLRVMRDDGAATYLNGTQISRGNLPWQSDYLTPARTTNGPGTENQFFNAAVNPALLVSGVNVVAVEVHQVTANSPDLSFDFELVERAGVANDMPPAVRLTSPAAQQTFGASASVGLNANVMPGSGPILWVEFFANGQPLGRDLEAPYEAAWDNAPPGAYVVQAVATDANRKKGYSALVTVTVTSPGNRPVVNVSSPDRVAMEGSDNTAVFVITRTGDVSAPLTVYYSITGTATPSVDYLALPGTIEIAAGAESAAVVVQALADNEADHGELVTLTLDPPPCAGANPPRSDCYLIGAENSTFIGIIDPPPPPPGGNLTADPGALAAANQAALAIFQPQLGNFRVQPSGACVMSIIGPPGQTVTLEVSADMIEWTPLATLKNDTGALEFTDPSATNFTQSFYRVVVEP